VAPEPVKVTPCEPEEPPGKPGIAMLRAGAVTPCEPEELPGAVGVVVLEPVAVTPCEPVEPPGTADVAMPEFVAVPELTGLYTWLLAVFVAVVATAIWNPTGDSIMPFCEPVLAASTLDPLLLKSPRSLTSRPWLSEPAAFALTKCVFLSLPNGVEKLENVGHQT
jgi:hypothetical protein